MTDSPRSPKPTARGVLVAVPNGTTGTQRNGGDAPLPNGAAQASAAAKADDPKARAKAAIKERTNAKNAMVVSMGALVLTGYLAARGSRRDSGANAARIAHMVAGVALMGASYWHTTLYGPRQK